MDTYFQRHCVFDKPRCVFIIFHPTRSKGNIDPCSIMVWRDVSLGHIAS